MKKPDVIVHLDDDDNDIDLLREAMEASSQYRLVSLKTAPALLQYLHDHSPAVCLIVLDINLPHNDGIQVMKELKQHEVYRSIPTVMLTTGAHRPQRTDLETYRVDVFTKPFAFRDLVKIADQLLAMCANQPPKE